MLGYKASRLHSRGAFLHVWRDHPVTPITREIDDMATAVAEPTVEVVVVDRPIPDVPDSVAESYDRIQKGATKVRAKTKKGSKKVKGGVKKAWKKAKNGTKKAARAVRDKTVSIAKFVKVKSVKAGRWTAAKGRATGAAISRTSARFWSWVRPIGASMWDGTARALAWVVTPFRLMFGSALGWFAVLLYGGGAAFLVAIGWLAYVASRAGYRSRRRVKRTRRMYTSVNGDSAAHATSATAETTVDGIATGARLELEPEMAKSIKERMNTLRVLGAKQTGDKHLLSNTEGRLHLLEERLAGNVADMTDIYRAYRTAFEARAKDEGATVTIDWKQFNTGMRSEDRLLRKVFQAGRDSTGELKTGDHVVTGTVPVT